MARYVDTALSAGEPILYDAKVHWAVFLFPILWTLAVVAAVAAVLAFFPKFVPTLDFSLDNISGKIWVIVVAVFVAFKVIGGLPYAIIYFYNSDFVLTDRRVMSKFGLLSRTTSEQRLSKVESIHVYQSFLGRLLNFGNITVTGTGSSTTTFGPMVDPIACKRAIEAQLDLVKPGA